jgi:hypothetical protein
MNGEISGLAVINSHIAEVKKRTSLWECRDIDIVLCKDRNGINTGSVFIRSSEWTDKFIEKWISYENDTEILKHDRIGIFEQPAFNHMFNNNILNLKDHLSIIDQRKMNSYWENYQTGYILLLSNGLVITYCMLQGEDSSGSLILLNQKGCMKFEKPFKIIQDLYSLLFKPYPPFLPFHSHQHQR